MPLQPQSQEIAFRFGLDVTENEEGQPKGALEFVNFDFDDDGVIRRRGGFQYAGSTSQSPDVINDTDVRLLLQDAHSPMGISAGIVAKPERTITTLSPGARVQNVDAAFDPAGFTCVVATGALESSADNQSGLLTAMRTFVYVVNQSTGQILFVQTLGTATTTAASAARVVVTSYQSGGTTHVCWLVAYLERSAGTIKIYQIERTSATIDTFRFVGSPLTITGVSSGIRPMDLAATSGGTTILAYATTAATFLKQTLIPSASGPALSGASSQVIPGALPNVAMTSIWVWCTRITNAFVYGYLDTGTGNIHIVAGSGDVSLGTNGAYGLPIVTADESASGTLHVFWEWADSSSLPIGIKFAPVTISSAALGTVNLFLGARLGLRARYTDKITIGFFPWDVETNGYANLYLGQLTASGTSITPVGQACFDEYGYWGTNYAGLQDVVENGMQYLPPIVSVGVGTGKYLIPVPVTLESGPHSVGRTSTQVRRLRLIETIIGAPSSIELPIVSAHLQNTHFISGSYLMACDETRLFPAAFLFAPPKPRLSTANVGTQIRGYQVVCEFVDAHGNIQVSPPGPVSTCIAGAGAVTVAFEIPDYWPAIRVPALASPAAAYTNQSSLRVKIYRTQPNGSTFNLVYTTTFSDADAPPYAVSFTDTETDANVALGETIYTTGNALVSELAPPVRHLTAHRNRLFAVRQDIPETIAFTTETFEPNYPRWNAVLSFRVDNQGGPPLAVASLFDKLIILQHDQICMVAGEGPDALGNGAFSLPETIARGVGVEPDQIGSVVETPSGIFFAHRTGIHLLTPDLQVVPIGQAVGGKDFGTNYPIYRARYLPSRNQVWFMSPGVVFVYDLRASKWTTFTGVWTTLRDTSEVDVPSSIPASRSIYAIYPSTYGSTYLQYRPDYRLDTPVGASSGASYFSQVVGLPWLRVDRAQEMRLWKVFVTGVQTLDPADRASILVEAFSQDERRAKSSTTRDNAYTWTAAQLAAESANFFLRARVVSQRGRALRCRLTITPDPTAYLGGELFDLSALTYDFGVLPGRGKARTRAGAST